MDIVNKEVQLNVKLHFHGLRVFGSHGKRNKLCEFAEKLVPTALIE